MEIFFAGGLAKLNALKIISHVESDENTVLVDAVFKLYVK